MGIPLEQALQMASLMPARIAGIEGACGSIDEGKRGDLIVFDEMFQIMLTIIGGRVSFDAR